MRTIAILLLLSSAASAAITWERRQLHGDFYSEGAAIGDINGDGKPDVVAGPFWWEGPAFEKKHAYYEPKIFNINGYSDNFFAYVYDFNADKRNDILILGFPGKEARLYLNPGAAQGHWPMHIVADVVDNESPVFTDSTGDGKPEIVCSTGGRFGCFAPNWEKPTEKWPFIAVTEDMKVAKFTHGLGVGDVNGDGKLDLLEARRWWENNGSDKWTQHNFAAGIGGGAQMFAHDFDGNGTNDVFTSLQAHRYGVAVYLQQKEAPTWRRIMLASEQPQDNDYGIVFSQPHAAALADINGDGIKDIVTGKRYWAHNGHDPDERGHRVVYWYETKRDGKGGVDFIPHLVDAASGVGVDVTVGDVNGDNLPDIVTANKAGVFLLTQQRSDTAAAVPVKLYGPGLKPQADYAKGQSAADAVKNIQLPTGFKAALIAAEPDVVQPIAFTFDERGRIWVVEGNSYPQPREVGKGQDRIKILEDKDGDGTFETKKIFCEGLNLVSGIELGFGGVWVGAAPYLLFIPDADKDDRADGAAEKIEDRGEKIEKTTAKGNLSSPLYPLSSFPLAPGLNFTAYALLDGWGTQDTHETLNSFIWGPDGWLYGCHGVFTHSRVGKPGTPDDQRQPINAGVWRYHPLRHEFEVFAHGTSNPWGLDYDQHGEWFVTACVIPHLYHIVSGGRYHRQAGQHFDPHTYEDIKTIADHAHYAGNPRPDVTFDKTTGAGVMNSDTNALGGGHAHCGLAIYQSSLFPPTYRNQMIFGNLHGHRLVANYTDVNGSSYTGKHAADFMRTNDMHFIPVTQKVGPDGALYVSDWSDQQICHRGSGAVEHWDRSNGRIYRIGYQRNLSDLTNPSDQSIPPQAPFDLAKESDETLAKLAVQTKSSWHSRMAQRIQRERDPGFATFIQPLHEAMGTAIDRRKTASDLQRRPLTERQDLATALLKHGEDKDDPMIPLLIWYGIEPVVAADPAVGMQLAKASKMPKVTGFIYRRLSSEPEGRNTLLRALAGITPEKKTTSASSVGVPGPSVRTSPPSERTSGPSVRTSPSSGSASESSVRTSPSSGRTSEPSVRTSPSSGSASEPSVRTSTPQGEPVGSAFSPAEREVVLATIVATARGAGRLTPPADWHAIAEGLRADATPATLALVQELAALFGEKTALEHYRTLLTDKNLATPQRETALTILLQAQDRGTATLLQQIITSSDSPAALRRRAIQALSSLGDAQTPAILSSALPKLPASDLPDAINTLASTKEGAKALLKAVESKTVAATALSPFLIRQLTAFNDAEINALIKSAWGDVNAPKADMAERVKKYKDLLTPAALAKGDLAKGKLLFQGVCGACHKLFGQGQNVGPDITGSNRADLGYLLENVLDPNAVIGKAYQLNLFTMKDGRLMSGVIKEETTAAVRIAMMGGVEFTLPVADIAKREVSKLSTMPEGLFDALQPEMVIDLVKYLQSGASTATATQVAGALEGESLKVLEITGGQAKKQAMGAFGPDWSGAAQLWWTGGKPDQKLSLALPVKDAGKYALKGALTMARDYGVVSILLNGKPIASSFDGYNSPKVIHTGERDWGIHELSAGEHQLSFILAPPNPAAVPSNMVGLDYVRLEKQ